MSLKVSLRSSVRIVLYGALLFVYIGVIYSLVTFDGKCGLIWSELGSRPDCSITEFLTNGDGLLLSFLYWINDYWMLFPVVMIIVVFVSYWDGKR